MRKPSRQVVGFTVGAAILLAAVPAHADPQSYSPPAIVVTVNGTATTVTHDSSPKPLNLGSQPASVTVQATSRGSGRNGGGMGCQFGWSLNGATPVPPATGFIGADAGDGSFPQTFALGVPATFLLTLDCAPGVPQGQPLPDPGMPLEKGYVSVKVSTEIPPSPAAAQSNPSATLVPKPAPPKPAPVKTVPPNSAVQVAVIPVAVVATGASVAEPSLSAPAPVVLPQPVQVPAGAVGTILTLKPVSVHRGPGFPWGKVLMLLGVLGTAVLVTLRRATGVRRVG